MTEDTYQDDTHTFLINLDRIEVADVIVRLLSAREQITAEVRPGPHALYKWSIWVQTADLQRSGWSRSAVQSYARGIHHGWLVAHQPQSVKVLADSEASRETDALVAEQIIGLRVVARDWPCGYEPDGCQLEASPYPDETNPDYEPHPVYVPEHGIWPPVVMESEFYDRVGLTPEDRKEAGLDRLRARVEPVPRYSTNHAAACDLIEHMQKVGWHWELSDCNGEVIVVFIRGWYDGAKDEWEITYSAIGPTLPLAVCRAALATTERPS